MTDDTKRFLEAGSGISESDKEKLASGNYEVVLEENVDADGWKYNKGVIKEKDGLER